MHILIVKVAVAYTPPINTIEFVPSMVTIVSFQEVIKCYNNTLITEAAALLVDRWNTSELDIPRDMVAPCMRMVKLPAMRQFVAVKEVHGDRQVNIRETKFGSHGEEHHHIRFLFTFLFFGLSISLSKHRQTHARTRTHAHTRERETEHGNVTGV